MALVLLMLKKMFGAMAISDSADVDLVIKLVPFEADADYNRLGDETMRYTRILNVLVPTLVLPVSAGRNTAALIESAVSNFRLSEAGFNSADEIRERFKDFMVAANEREGKA